ncbi:21277_t:CDS:10 [Gigaspora margarita]|uniref:21277_t:CDS:1 n=1 Tax=Gigaspora margarita TaxID=4874 RepID=A0ABN7VF66_GIGMA|nr:21277_t:CDS:10 [Gigaspora margarita]
MTLKEQERVVDEIKKENFGLKMKNIEIKVQNQDLKNEIKEYKKLLLESDKAIQTLQQNGTDCLLQHGMSADEEAEYHRAINRVEEVSQENDRIQRKLAERQSEVKRLREIIKLTKPEFNFDDETSLDLLESSTEHQQLKELINRDNRLSGDQNTKITMLKETLRKERDEKHTLSLEVEGLRQQLLDLKSQLTESNLELKRLQDAPMIDDRDMDRKINDATDKARQDEIEKLKEQITNLNKQLASRTNENDDLYSELEMIKGPLSSTSSRGDIASRLFNGEFSEQYEESLGNLRDKVAELTLQLREKSMEVDQLVAELERSTLTHSASVQDFEDEMDRMEGQFQEENALLRDQLDELQNENGQLVYELETLDRICQENDIRYEESKTQLENQQREILDLSQSVEKYQTELENKSKELINLTESLESLKKEIQDKNSTIDELRAQIVYLENRIKELECREKEAEERLQTEKQSAKEKGESLIENIKDIETQLQAQNRRNTQLQEMISMQKASMEEATNESKVRAAKVENTFAMLNEQLREQLEEKNKTIENERQRVKNLEDQFSSMLEEQKRLHSQVERRESMINKVLSGLQMINQRKDVMENAALKNITEDMQITLSLDRKPSYQPPAYINPPWKPAGNNLNATPKKTVVRNPSTKSSSIPVSSLKSRGVSSTKSLIPTPSEK